jgi:predicted RNA-binding Zn-ribbon protein involved in translation (DUF1610 family)
VHEAARAKAQSGQPWANPHLLNLPWGRGTRGDTANCWSAVNYPERVCRPRECAAISESRQQHPEQCGLCGGALTYLEEGTQFTCSLCGQTEIGHVHCAQGHYLCETCHGAEIRELLPQLLAASPEVSPADLAERLLSLSQLPMLGCEHALIAAGALMTSLKNRGGLGVTDRHVAEVLQRTERQAISAYCGLSGVCGVVPALGACYSVLVGAQCGKGPETRATMELVSRLAALTAEEAEPGCCKAFVRSCLAETEDFLKERLGIDPSGASVSVCRDVDRHPHGCRGPACAYHPNHRSARERAKPETEPAGAQNVHGASCFEAATLVEATSGG